MWGVSLHFLWSLSTLVGDFVHTRAQVVHTSGVLVHTSGEFYFILSQFIIIHLIFISFVFYFLFYFILFYCILFYFILFYLILSYFILFYFILFYFIFNLFLFYFILFYLILFILFYSPPFVSAPRSARWPWARLPLPPTPSAPKAGPSWRRLLRGRWSLAIIFYRLVAGASARVTPPRVQGTAPRAGKQLWGLATGCGETSPPRRVGLRCKGFARGKAAKGQPDWALFQADALRLPKPQFSILFHWILFCLILFIYFISILL